MNADEARLELVQCGINLSNQKALVHSLNDECQAANRELIDAVSTEQELHALFDASLEVYLGILGVTL